MSIEHKVEAGEHLSEIALKYGFRDPDLIWEHDDNAELRDLRKSPNVLMEGDKVAIPEDVKSVVTVPTGRKNRLTVATGRTFLRLVLLNFDNEPLPDTEVRLDVDGRTQSAKTDKDGRLEARIPADAKEARLLFQDPTAPFDRELAVRIGHLDPVEEASGQKARLINLGYLSGAPEDVDDTKFAHAIQEFQCDSKLKVSGEFDDETMTKLKDLHGS